MVTPTGFGDVVERLRRSTVLIGSGRGGAGSGIIWSNDGVIVTNAHVVPGQQARVQLWDGRTLHARVDALAQGRDLARLKVDAQDLPAVETIPAHSVKSGALTLAVGNPLGFQGAVSTGLLQGVARVPSLGPLEWVVSNVRLAPGNSGGPLADASGRVLGINTMIAGGLGFAVPVEAVKQFLAAPAPRRLGVTLEPSREGLRIVAVERGSAAERASLQAGDYLVSAGGARLRSPRDLLIALETTEGPLRLGFRRGDNRAIREVTAA